MVEKLQMVGFALSVYSNEGRLQILCSLLVLHIHMIHVTYMSVQAIVDPFVYIHRLTMPKLIISSSNDEFFLIDDR